MNLVYVIGLFPKTSETFILEEILELGRQGEQVTVCSLRPPRKKGARHPGTEELMAATIYVPDRARGVAVMVAALAGQFLRHPLRSARATGWAVGWAMRGRSVAELARLGQAAVLAGRLARTGSRADHIHAHFAHGPASAALLLSVLTDTPFSFTGHAREIFERFRDPSLAAKARRAKFVVAISEHGQARITEAVAPADRHKVVLVRNGIDLHQFGLPPRGGRRPGRVVSVARAVPMKGLDTLLDACAVLRDRGVSFSCDIVGDGPLRSALANQVHRLGLTGHVRMLGSADRATVIATLHEAQVFALPSRPDPAGDMDGLPVSIVEAMATGLPVVSTPVTGIPEVVHNDRTGLLVPPDDPAALAGALEKILNDDLLRTRFSNAAVAVAAGYNRPRWIRVLRELFRDGPEVPPPGPGTVTAQRSGDAPAMEALAEERA